MALVKFDSDLGSRSEQATRRPGTGERRASVAVAPERPSPDGRRPPFAFYMLSRELRCAVDADGRFVAAEGAWDRVLGQHPDDLRGCELAEFVHPADRFRLVTAFKRIHADAVCRLELRVAHRSGGYRVISWDAAPTRGSDGLLLVGLECTREQRREDHSQRALKRLRDENAGLVAKLGSLEKRHDEVERFAALAAHQLCEPLIVAESSAIMLAEELGDGLDPSLKGRVDAIARSASRARMLIDALLHDARTADVPLQLRPVDVASVAADTLSLFELHIQEHCVTPMVAPLPTVQSEPRLLGVVFQNLISNALKYGPRHGHIHVGATRQSAGWSLTVGSEGPTIPEDEMQRIFKPFRRVPGERRAPGTGLGLAICSRLAERLGGTIGVRPGVPGGNVFFVEIPDPT